MLVLLPGMDGTGDLFAPLLAELGGSVQTLVVRYPDRPLDYAGHEAIARALLPQDRPYVILGESFSGPIAISLAATSPENMLGLILCGSFASCPRSALKWLRPLIGQMPMSRIPTPLASFYMMGRYATPALRHLYADVLAKVSADTLRARLTAIAEVDVGEALRRVDIPGLYLRATEDCMVPEAAARNIARLNSKLRMESIEGPHLLLQAKAKAAADVIRVFIRDFSEDRLAIRGRAE